MEVNFNIETESEAKTRLTAGYRGRRNFLVYELLSMIVMATPVKDGYARGGWYISVGRDRSGSNRPPDKDGTNTIFGALPSLKGGSVFKDVYILNDVDYIDDLERGSSTQAPEGMVRVSVSAFKSMYGDVS